MQDFNWRKSRNNKRLFRCKINISSANKATGKDYATITKYRAVIGEKQKKIGYSNSSNVSGQIDNVDSNVFTVYAIDSREIQLQNKLAQVHFIIIQI